MKKYLIFMLLLLVSIGARAESVDMSFSETDQTINASWKFAKVNNDDLYQLQAGDFIVVSFNAAIKENQYAVKTGDGATAYLHWTVENESKDYFTCDGGEKDFTFTVTSDMLADFRNNKGLRIEYNGLSGLSIKRVRMSDNWSSYKPTDKANWQEIMSTPQYIKDWYSGAYCLKGSYYDKKGYTLRVVCLETADDSYAFLKINDGDKGWPAIMSGSDKFSIAGWKYFEITLNQELLDIINNQGLLIGGNNYFIAGIYIYGNKNDNVETWSDGDVVDTYTITGKNPNSTSGTWKYYDIPAGFFEYKDGDQISDDKIANTKNNIIRVNYTGATTGAQITATDNYSVANNQYASYVRYRKWEGEIPYYVDFLDCSTTDSHMDFELSDAITVFNSGASTVPGTEINTKLPVTGDAGVKKGMLSTLLQHGMRVGGNNMTISSVQILHSQVSKYVSGRAEYVHPLSDKVWRPIALPYNLTRQQVEDAFGQNVLICDLGASYVSKKKVIENGIAHYEYGINFSFDNVQVSNGNKNAEYLNADYPYIIKLKDTGSANTPSFAYDESKGGYQGTYIFNNVKADVRDFQAYEFRTGTFSFGRSGEGVSADEKFMDPKVEPIDTKEHQIWEFEQQIRNDVGNAYMIFQSTAPVFNITNTGVGEVEIIDSDVQLYTPFSWTDKQYYNYYFSDGKLWSGNKFDTNKKGVKSGLAYVRFPAATYKLFEGQNQVTPASVSLAKFSCSFPDDNNTTGIEEMIAQPKKQNTVGIYSLGGQLIRKGTTTDGLAKGIYIVNGKKVIVNQ